MAKRKKKKPVNSSFLTYMAWGLAVIAVVLSSLIGGYYLGYEDAKQEILERSKLSKQKRLTMLKKLEDVSSKPKQNVNTRLKDILKKDVKTYTAASHEYSSPEALKPPIRLKRDIKRISSKPKLAIIIDDVCVKSHVKAIKRVGIPVTMSFLPPSKNRPNSAKLASNEKVYMVHLPLEAQSYSAEEPSTLRTDDSSAKITSRVQYIKKIFPRVSYVNNHTGSKFTSNELAVNRLIYALKKEKINFIDSRTTADTKVPMVMKNLGLNYVARDVFLDHYTDKKSIKKAIIKAIRIAKDHGTAVAIGHPHTNTLLALSESKKLFKDVELVYIDRLY